MIREYIESSKGIFVDQGVNPFLDKSYEIAPMPDSRHDDKWSEELDQNIESYLGKHFTQEMDQVTLFAGRDSFLLNYHGKYSDHDIVPSYDGEPTGTEFRESVIAPIDHYNFRAGVIYAHNRRHPTVYPTVDVAIFNHDYTKILLIRKPGEVQYQLCGGFADPSSESYEEDAIREVKEECGVLIHSVRYLTSRKIDDWRYRREIDCIKTMLFAAVTNDTEATAGDDAEEVKWFNVCNSMKDGIPEEQIFEGHRSLLSLACGYGYAMSVM